MKNKIINVNKYCEIKRQRNWYKYYTKRKK